MTTLAEAALRAAHERTRRTTRSTLRAHGIVPTPVALARAALARVDLLLRSELGVTDGLASERVALLDPAVGTGVWLAAALEQTHPSGRVGTLIGIDLDADVLRETAALLQPEVAAQGGQLRLRCTNTLALESAFDDDRVRVIVGNPPWAARSASRGCALSDGWLDEFRHDATGRPLGERRAGVLSDDYVRFVRWSLEQARTAPQGALVCLATNASFLDGPVHRGMRAALVAGFDRLELVDLGGNALLSRGEGRDENVFGVRVGAALTIAVRCPSPGPRAAQVATCASRERAARSSRPCRRWRALCACTRPARPGTRCGRWRARRAAKASRWMKRFAFIARGCRPIATRSRWHARASS